MIPQKTSSAGAGEVETRSGENEGDRAAPKRTFFVPGARRLARSRRQVAKWLRADPITLTLGASRLDLSRAQRGRGWVLP